MHETIESLISKNNNAVDINFFFVVDQLDYVRDLRTILSSLSSEELILDIACNSKSWAENSNFVINKFINQFDYFLFSHDDLSVITPDYLFSTISFIESLSWPVGWTTFTSVGYHNLRSPNSNSVRTGFALDRFKDPKVFECASFATSKLGQIQKPDSPVYAHAPFSHLNLIASSSLKLVGEFPNWSPYTILLDEDQGLRALSMNLPNIWIPSVEYFHPLRYSSRKIGGTRFDNQAHGHFRARWGISDMPYSSKDIEYSLTNYGELFNWTAGRNSFDWKYVRDRDYFGGDFGNS